MSDALRQPVECVVEVDGDEIASLYPYLEEAMVDMTRGAATTGTLVFHSIRGRDGRWAVQDAGDGEPLLRPWRRVKSSNVPSGVSDAPGRSVVPHPNVATGQIVAGAGHIERSVLWSEKSGAQALRFLGRLRVTIPMGPRFS